MVLKSCEPVDPRIRRTRLLLQESLLKLLEKKEFEEISVQDIAEAATLNRATFYDHFPDKFALLEYVVGGGFHKLLEKRQVQFDGACSSGLKSIVLAVCDYLEQIRGSDCKRQSQPHMQAAIIAVVQRLIVEGLKACAPQGEVTPELAGAAASWAIYGAASEWAQTPDHCSSEEIADSVTRLVAPLLLQRTAGIG